MEQHLKLMKQSIETIQENSDKMTHALIGNEFTGGMGLIHRVKKVDECVQKNTDDISILKENMNLVKYIGGIVCASTIALIFYIIQTKL